MEIKFEKLSEWQGEDIKNFVGFYK